MAHSRFPNVSHQVQILPSTHIFRPIHHIKKSPLAIALRPFRKPKAQKEGVKIAFCQDIDEGSIGGGIFNCYLHLGPEGGKNGGELLFEGTPEDLKACENSITAQYI